MASLTEASIIARKIIRYSIYAVILIIIARFTFNLGVTIYRRFFPPRAPEPTVGFGRLTKIPFPEKPKPENLDFELETADGKLPPLPEQLEVYFMPPSPTSLKALEEAKEKATLLMFKSEGKPIVEGVGNVYIFRKRGAPSTLTMNIITGIFSISYDLAQASNLLTGIPPNPESATQQVTSYLSGANLLTPELEKGRTSHQFLKIEGNKFVPVVSLSESNLIKINIFRKNYGPKEEVPSVTPDFPEGNVWFILGSAGARQIVAGEYNYYPVDANNFSTYPIKSSEQAWEDLKAAKGYIANLGGNTDGNITIREVYLAYYDAGQYTEFYQPVVVFEGDDDFIAYVPGVTDEFYGGEEE